MGESSASAKADNESVIVEKKGAVSSRKDKQNVEPSLNMDELRDLANLVIEHGFTDFEFENENIRVRLSKMTTTQFAQAAQGAQMPVSALSVSPPAEQGSPAPAEDEDARLLKITSPIVGTFYRSPGPDKEPFVSEGSVVSADTTVCIVEAMKLMNEIQAEISGKVVKIYVENGQPVEYGQPLFGLRK
ncbi:MAG: acetyl-CoA carboxylase biotin carboxyl carrier protein [Pyrinomonadaceae bacterium]